jgi:AcrR family transcriptional regulator
VEAAAALFEEQGYGRTTVKQIAAAAGVAPDTVYATFGTKARVLTALIDARLAPPTTGVSNVMDRVEAQAISTETDQREQLRLFARDMTNVLARVGPVYEIMRTASSVDPEMADVFAEMEGYRANNIRRAAGWIEANGPLRVDVERAAEIMWTLASPDVGRMLRGRRGWSDDDYADWLCDTLTRTLLRDSSTS